MMGKDLDAGMENGCRKRQMMGKDLDAGMEMDTNTFAVRGCEM